jgi:hypothetical protein
MIAAGHLHPLNQEQAAALDRIRLLIRVRRVSICAGSPAPARPRF